MSGADQVHWKHTWPSANVLAQFICINEHLFKNRNILEIGSGATGICGLTAAKLGANRVWLTDHPKIGKALECLQGNVYKNQVAENCVVTGLDWDDEESLRTVLNDIESLDLIIASDVFFDPSTFRGLVRTIADLLNRFPAAVVWFAYQERDDNWTCARLFEHYSLEATLIRKVETGQHTIEIGSIVKKSRCKMFAGIEGGATASKLVLTDKSGEKRIFSETNGTNYYLQGIESVGDQVATWIRKIAQENSIVLPLESLGMGLSGAEDEELNNKFKMYLKMHHGDIAKHFYLSSDAVCTVAANFSNQGMVLIAGTGSSCRMLLKNGEVKGAGGWGHMIGDGCSAFWIANRAMRILFDHDDGLEPSPHSVETIRKLLCQHFKIADKIGILDYLYKKFEKHRIAGFTKTLAEHASDPAIAQLFDDAGHMIAKHVRAVCRGLEPGDLENVDIVLVGSVFKSWSLLRNGFKNELQNAGIRKLTIYSPSEEPSIGAAVIGAREAGIEIEHAKNKIVKEIIEF
ncbi:unnamed protein product [Caenorhabditis bovis]|uniref:N-acetyl-D-glucosamine kinase n=1 Tax=Caenorhabditis bovis TaxID=2654633 RepID=A0A8S1ESD6_9PELO|nr:unnamed protein product [Caenorhabditis bovis]